MGMICYLRLLSDSEIALLKGNADQVVNLFARDAADGKSMSLEKAWHGLHYLMTGHSRKGDAPLCFLCHDGEEMGPRLSYGRVRLFRPAFLERLRSALAALSDDELWRRYDSDKLAREQIYPDIWDEPEEDLREEYLSYFRELKQLIERSCREGTNLAVVVL